MGTGSSDRQDLGFAAEQLLCNRLKLHVTGAFVNCADLGVAVELFDRALFREADATEDVERFGGDTNGGFRGNELSHGGFSEKGLAGILKSGGVVDEQAHRLDISRHLCQLELQALELSNGFAELFAFLGVAEGVIERGLGNPEALRVRFARDVPAAEQHALRAAIWEHMDADVSLQWETA